MACINPQEIDENPVGPDFRQAKFSRHCLHEATNILQLGMEGQQKLRPLLSLSTSCGLLGLQSHGLASLGRYISINQISCCCLFHDVQLIMLDSTQLDTELEICNL